MKKKLRYTHISNSKEASSHPHTERGHYLIKLFPIRGGGPRFVDALFVDDFLEFLEVFLEFRLNI